MDNQWKTETCGNCDFVPDGFHWVGGEKSTGLAGCIGKCRKNPPNWSTEDESGLPIMMYPEVLQGEQACSFWRENKNTKEIS